MTLSREFKPVRLLLWLTGVTVTSLIGACTTAPEANDGSNDSSSTRKAVVPTQSDFELRQKERAVTLGRQGRLADAAVVWEILGLLRPDVPEYREQWAKTQSQIETMAADRLQRAAQAQRRGELEAATQWYLAALALQPDQTQAADALRAIERERNKRNVLGRAARLAPTPRTPAPPRLSSAEPASSAPAALGDRNELEHAAMLTIQGDFDDAIQLLERRLANARQDDVARTLLADAYFQKAEELVPRDKAEALVSLEKSVRLDPSHPLAATRLKQLKTAGVGSADPTAAPRSEDKSGVRPGRNRNERRATP